MTKRQIIFNGIATALIMSCIISAGLTLWNVGASALLQSWPRTWLRAFIIALPCVFVVPRFIKWLMKRLKI